MSDGLGILLAFAVVLAPLVLAWFLFVKYHEPREPSHLPERKK